MKVGLTFDLRAEYLAAGYSEEETAEFDQADTIDALEDALRSLGHRTHRIGNVVQLVQRLCVGERWDLVFNIAEGIDGFGREAQVPALLEAFRVPYTFSDPLVSALTLHKGVTKRVLRDLGLPTPDFRVVESEADIEAVDLPWPLFVKPVAEGTAKGIDSGSLVRTRAELAERCRRVLARQRQPALVETYLAGREFTVGIIGTGLAARALGTLEVVLLPNAEPHAYSYRNKEHSEECCSYVLAAPEDALELERLALAAWRGLGARDGGRVDLRLDAEGRPNLLELNPLPGLHPTHSDLPMICSAVGVSYEELVGWIVESASERAGLPARRGRHPRPTPARTGREAAARERA